MRHAQYTNSIFFTKKVKTIIVLFGCVIRKILFGVVSGDGSEVNANVMWYSMMKEMTVVLRPGGGPEVNAKHFVVRYDQTPNM